MGIGIIQHMIGTNQLVIMGRINNFTWMSRLLLPLLDLQNYARSQLIVEVVQMAYIRLEILQNQANFLSCLSRIDGFNRICQLCQFAAAVKIHIRGIGLHTVAHTAARVLHTKILDVMSQTM